MGSVRVVFVLLITMAAAAFCGSAALAQPSGQAAPAAGMPQAPTVPATTPAPQAGAGGGADELSSQATDPTAPLMSFNVISDVVSSYWKLDDDGYTFKFQPVVPFRAWGVNNLLRVVVPYQISGPGDEGLKSVTIFDMLVFPQSWGRLAFGPVMSLSESAGAAESKFSIGPAVGMMKPISKKLNTGVFTQNLFASAVGITQLQPIVAYQLGHGWAVGLGDLQFTYDWQRDEWVLVPIGGEIGVVRAAAGQMMRFSLGAQYNFRNLEGTDRFKLVIGIKLLAPMK